MKYDKSHNSPYDRGDADAYYGRKPSPHKYVTDKDNPKSSKRVELTDDNEIAAYHAGYSSGDTGTKDYGHNYKKPPSARLF